MKKSHATAAIIALLVAFGSFVYAANAPSRAEQEEINKKLDSFNKGGVTSTTRNPNNPVGHPRENTNRRKDLPREEILPFTSSASGSDKCTYSKSYECCLAVGLSRGQCDYIHDRGKWAK
jgi:hypothetical protein